MERSVLRDSLGEWLNASLLRIFDENLSPPLGSPISINEMSLLSSSELFFDSANWKMNLCIPLNHLGIQALRQVGRQVVVKPFYFNVLSIRPQRSAVHLTSSYNAACKSPEWSPSLIRWTPKAPLAKRGSGVCDYSRRKSNWKFKSPNALPWGKILQFLQFICLQFHLKPNSLSSLFRSSGWHPVDAQLFLAAFKLSDPFERIIDASHLTAREFTRCGQLNRWDVRFENDVFSTRESPMQNLQWRYSGTESSLKDSRQ